MTDLLAEHPDPQEYPEYYGRYIQAAPDGDVLALLSRQIDATCTLLEEIGEEDAMYRYEEGKWSVKEIVGHLADTERIFAVRALRMARGDTTPQPGFEQDDYVAAARFDDLPLEALIHELRTLRGSVLRLFQNLDEEALRRRGVANDVEFTVRSIPWIIAGHEAHHVGVIRERYLPGL